MHDDFGDRMKLYEKMEARRLMPLLPACVRLDGKCFSRYTKNLNRPYDMDFIDTMQQTARALVEITNACIGYVQSDEISLIWHSEEYKSQIFMDGRIQKMVSLLAAECSTIFNSLVDANPTMYDKISRRRAIFDCRAWNVPNKIEAANVLLWREQDATRNSIQMAAQAVFSHKQLHKKSCSDLQEMLHQEGINWDKYPRCFKRGTFYQRYKVARPFTADEIENLPEMHEARRNPDLKIERTEIRMVDMPPFGRVLNRVGVIFDGADPRTA